MAVSGRNRTLSVVYIDRVTAFKVLQHRIRATALGRSNVVELRSLRWDSSTSVEVNENINLGYSQDQGNS